MRLRQMTQALPRERALAGLGFELGAVALKCAFGFGCELLGSKAKEEEAAAPVIFERSATSNGGNVK